MKKCFFTLFSLVVSFVLISIGTPARAAETVVNASADTMINESSPDSTYGAAWYGIVSNQAGNNKCILVRFEDFSLPPEVILDEATLKFYLFDSLYSSDTELRIGPNDTSPTFDLAHEYSISWNNSPDRISSSDYITDNPIDVGVEEKEADVTKVVNAWMTGELENNGIYICVAPGEAQTYIKLYTREYSDADKRIYLSLSYHTATLGEPPVEETSTDDLSFNLVSPDGATLTNPPYDFRWEDPQASDPAREHLNIIVNQKNEDSSTTEVINEEIPITWTHYTSSIALEDGDYEWYIEAYDMDGLIYSTPHKNFKVDHNASMDEGDEDNAGTGDEFADDQDGQGQTADEDSNSNQNQGEQTDDSATQGQISRLMIGVIILLLAIIAILAGYLVYKNKKDKKSGARKAGRKTAGNEESD